MSYQYEEVLKVIRRSRATLIFSMGVPIVKSQWAPENRFPPVRQIIPRCTDAISWYADGDHSANVPYEYEGDLNVIRRSRATLIFPMDVPMVKPRWVSEVVSSC